ncbi:MAG: PAS domain S-box protein [Nitrospinota bacterium]|nr:PAS domain S-box protein [Nitrospinota bacterium]
MTALGIRTKLFLSFAALLLVMAIGGLYELRHNSRLAEQASRIYSESLTVTRSALQAKSGLLLIQHTLRDLTLLPAGEEMTRELELLDKEETAVYNELQIASKLAQGAEERMLAQDAIRLFDQWRPVKSEAISLFQSGKQGEAVEIITGQGARHVETLLESVNKLWILADKTANLLVAQTQKSVRTDGVYILVAFVFAFVLSVGLVIWVSQHIGGRLRQINEASMKISVGDFEQTVDVKGSDEIAQLGDTFNLMAFSLANLHDSLNRQIIAAREAKESRIRLEKAIEQAGEVVVITDLEGSIQYVNPAFERNTGYARNEVIGKNPRILKSGAHDEAFYKGMWDALASTGKWEGVITNRRKDGTLYFDQATISAVKNENGETVNYVAVKRDITEHRNTLEELRESQAVLASAQRIAHLGNWDLDLKTGGLKWSQEQYRIFGLADGEFAGTFEAFAALTHPEDRGQLEAAVKKALQNHTPFILQRRIILPDGRERIILEHGEPLYDSGNQPIRVIGATQDITDRVNAQKDLARLQEKERELQRENDELEKALFEQKSLSGWEQGSVTASLAGVGPLRERFPEVFRRFKHEYEALLDEYLDALGFNRTPPRQKINTLSESIGAYGGGPKDLIDLHIRSVSDKSRDVHPKRARAYTVEGRLLAIEAMGNLVDYYRRGGRLAGSRTKEQ